MAATVQLVPFLLIAFASLTWAQEGTVDPETTTHINPHVPVTATVRNEPEEHTTHNSYLYRGRPISTVHFGEPHRRPRPPSTVPVHPRNHNEHHTAPVVFPDATTSHSSEHSHHTSMEHPHHTSTSHSAEHTDHTSTSHTTEHPDHSSTMHTPQDTTGWRWVYSGGRWHRVHGGATTHTTGSGGSSHGDVSTSGHHPSHGHHIVHVDSSETNNWNHAIHHEFNSGQIQKNYSRTSDNSGHSSPDDSSSSSSSHSGSGQSHGSSGSGESGSSGSGEHSASGSGSE
ncbi:unnamed protein product [Nezara viridula]|uniref:Neuropeptide n=1 Tax=Nezara viridula TaxID=85310 RepID=A0A9P0GZY0_NEZVI|nr:unnamed protein product [Nezara viridula]